MINSGLSEIKNHFGTKSHAENVSKLSERNGAAFDDFDVSDNPENIQEKIQIAEIALCAFFVEHNIPFHISAYLIGLLKVTFPDSYIQGVTLPIVNTLGGDSVGEYMSKIKSDEIALNASFINYRWLNIGVWNA